MARALRLASTTFEDIDPVPTVFIQGTSLLLDDVRAEYPELTLKTLRTLFRMIEEKTRLVQLLDDCLGMPGLTVVIGTEHQAPDLQCFSLVASTYSDGHGTGAVGVIGPTRMRYSRAIKRLTRCRRQSAAWSPANKPGIGVLQGSTRFYKVLPGSFTWNSNELCSTNSVEPRTNPVEPSRTLQNPVEPNRA
jgi:heat-inducible transcriptional repressor